MGREKINDPYLVLVGPLEYCSPTIRLAPLPESYAIRHGIPYTGVLGGLVGGPRAYQDQFRGFKSHRVHARRVFFLH